MRDLGAGASSTVTPYLCLIGKKMLGQQKFPGGSTLLAQLCIKYSKMKGACDVTFWHHSLWRYHYIFISYAIKILLGKSV